MKIGDLVNTDIRGLWGEEPTESNAIPVIKTNNMTYEGIIDYSDLTLRSIGKEKFAKNCLKKGDLIIEKSGGTKTHSVGYVNYFDGEDDKYVTNNFILVLRPNKDLILPKYLFYVLKYKYENGHFYDCYNKTTGIQNLQVKAYLAKEIKVPSFEEQQKIIDILDNIQNEIIVKREQIVRLNEAVKSRFIETFKTIDLSAQSDDWETLESLSKIYTGTTPSTSDLLNWDGNICWITPAEIDSDTFIVRDTVRKITEKGRKSKSLDIMPVGTVLLSTRAPIGKVGIVGTPMACNQGFKNFECGEKLNPVYLYVLLKANTEYLNSLGTGTTFLEVSKSKIAKMKVPVPALKEQNNFEIFVLSIHKAKCCINEQVDNLTELFNSKMSEYCERE